MENYRGSVPDFLPARDGCIQTEKAVLNIDRL